MTKRINIYMADTCPDCDSSDIFLEHYTDLTIDSNHSAKSSIMVSNFIAQRCIDCGCTVGILGIGDFLDRINKDLLDNSYTYKQLPTNGREF